MDEYERVADDLRREGDHMQKGADSLEGRIREVRSDWERKQNDPAVPGADNSANDQADSDPPPGGMERE